MLKYFQALEKRTEKECAKGEDFAKASKNDTKRRAARRTGSTSRRANARIIAILIHYTSATAVLVPYFQAAFPFRHARFSGAPAKNPFRTKARAGTRRPNPFSNPRVSSKRATAG